jgi:hypothetical protein
VSSDTNQEIQQLVEAALARHGAAGKVRVEGEALILAGNGPTVSLEIRHLIDKWSSLPFPERQRECAGLAKELSRQRRSLAPSAPKQRGSSFGGLVVAGLLLGAGALYWKLSEGSVHTPAAPAEAKVSSVQVVDPDHERRERGERVCNSTRARLARGGTVGPTDTEGWVVELALVRTPADATWPSIAPFVANQNSPDAGRVVWSGAPELAKLEALGTRVVVRDQALPDDVAPQLRQRLLTFYGEYVSPYFRERDRIKLIRLAHAVAEKQSATLGALYARCAEGTAHHMGSWFLGTSPGAAATSLLYFMGAHAEPPQLPRKLLSAVGDDALEPAFALGSLLDSSRRMKKEEVASLIGGQDGMVAGPAHFTTLSFPFVDSDRALRASHAIASSLPR